MKPENHVATRIPPHRNQAVHVARQRARREAGRRHAVVHAVEVEVDGEAGGGVGGAVCQDGLVGGGGGANF